MAAFRESAPFVRTWGFAFLYAGYAMIMMALVTTPLGEGRLGRTLQSFPARAVAVLGLYSYPVYLFHVELVRDPLLVVRTSSFVQGMSPVLQWVYLNGLLVLMSGAVGVIFNELVETRVLKVRDRLFPPKSATAAAEAPTSASPRAKEDVLSDSPWVSRAGRGDGLAGLSLDSSPGHGIFG